MSVCAISGRLPEEPVVSKKSGHVFEKRLILKHLELSSTCPITQTPLTQEDLLVLQTTSTVPPRPPTTLSFPQLLDTLRFEYDATLLENFALRQQLEQVKRDLSKQYYTLDASNRVIARLFQENEQLRAKLGDVTSATGAITRIITAQTTAVPVSGNAAVNTPSMIAEAENQIKSYTSLARTKLSGKENRSIVQKKITPKYPNAHTYLNAEISSDMVINQPSIELLTTSSDSTFVLPTSAALSQNQIDATAPYISYVATSANTVLIVSNDPTTKQSKILTTLQPSATTSSSNVRITTLCTTHFSPIQFPWIGNLVQSNNNDTMSDSTSYPPPFAAFLVSTTNNINQHNIQIYACAMESIADSTAWKCLHTVQASSPLVSLIIHPSQSFFAALNNKNVIEFFDISQPSSLQALSQPKYSLPFHTMAFPSSHQLSTITFHPDCNLMGLATYNGHVGMLSLQSFEPIWFPLSPNAEQKAITKIIFSENATQFITQVENYGYIVYCLKTQTILLDQAVKDLQTICYDRVGNFYALVTKHQILLHHHKDFSQLAIISLPENTSIHQLIMQHDNQSFIGIGIHDVIFIQPNV